MDDTSEEPENLCPLCMEEMDLTDRHLRPCHCGYQICVWCWHQIMDLAAKDNSEGRCPACRTIYDKAKIVDAAFNCEELMDLAVEKKRSHKTKARTQDGRKHLSNVRVLQRNLVYVVGFPLLLADEETLEKREYFGQYGKILKIAISRSAQHSHGGQTASVYVTFLKEDDAVRCIRAVDGCIFEGKLLRACFGTNKYCNAWLKNMPCNNPDCLYLHDEGPEEDSFTKEEMLAKYGSKHQYFNDLSRPPHRTAGTGLPPPISEASSSIATPPPKSSVKPSSVVTGSPGKFTSLPAAASWGMRGTPVKTLAPKVHANSTPRKKPTVVANFLPLNSSGVQPSSAGSEAAVSSGTHYGIIKQSASNASTNVAHGNSEDSGFTIQSNSSFLPDVHDSSSAISTSDMGSFKLKCTGRPIEIPGRLQARYGDKDHHVGSWDESFLSSSSQPLRQSSKSEFRVGSWTESSLSSNPQPEELQAFVNKEDFVEAEPSEQVSKHAKLEYNNTESSSIEADSNPGRLSGEKGCLHSPFEDNELRQGLFKDDSHSLSSSASVEYLSNSSSCSPSSDLAKLSEEADGVLRSNRMHADNTGTCQIGSKTSVSLNVGDMSINLLSEMEFPSCQHTAGTVEDSLPGNVGVHRVASFTEGASSRGLSATHEAFECTPVSPNVGCRQRNSAGENNIIADILTMDLNFSADDNLVSPGDLAKVLLSGKPSNESQKEGSMSSRCQTPRQSRFSFARQDYHEEQEKSCKGSVLEARGRFLDGNSYNFESFNSSLGDDFNYHKVGLGGSRQAAMALDQLETRTSRGFSTAEPSVSSSRSRLVAPPGFSGHGSLSAVSPPGFSLRSLSGRHQVISEAQVADSMKPMSPMIGHAVSGGNSSDIELIDPAIMAVGQQGRPVQLNHGHSSSQDLPSFPGVFSHALATDDMLMLGLQSQQGSLLPDLDAVFKHQQQRSSIPDNYFNLRYPVDGYARSDPSISALSSDGPVASHGPVASRMFSHLEGTYVPHSGALDYLGMNPAVLPEVRERMARENSLHKLRSLEMTMGLGSMSPGIQMNRLKDLYCHDLASRNVFFGNQQESSLTGLERPFLSNSPYHLEVEGKGTNNHGSALRQGALL